MSEQTVTDPTPFAFVPRPLEVEDRPELSVFPLNVMYVSTASIDGVDTSETSLYEPYFASYRRNDKTQCMRYYNKYSAVDYIDITYYFDVSKYIGVKYVKGKEVLSAYGSEWKAFFVHLTLNKLAKGEGRIFEPGFTHDNKENTRDV